jgi:UDPglucose--hexose-1-phosphate uridylyltransferase
MMRRKLISQLADGRELIYFDDAETTLAAERKPDLRALEPRAATGAMRLDPLTGDWISVASHRNKRAFLPPANACPLCPSSTTNASELPDLFDVAVFENKSPSFGPDLGVADTAAAASQGFGASMPAVGRCEVVVFSPEHTGSLGEMPVSRVRTVIEAWRDRTADLSTLPGVVQVFPFENRGQEIGVTLHHPHGQIYAYPFVTPTTTKLLGQVADYSGDFFADLLEFERNSERVVLTSKNFTAYVPFAARWPIELHLLPNRQLGSFTELTEAELDELAEVYSRLLRAIDAVYSTPTPYISAWHQAPNVAGGEKIRLQLQITSPRRAADKLKYLAGSESAMGAFISDVTPEMVAEQLRGALS